MPWDRRRTGRLDAPKRPLAALQVLVVRSPWRGADTQVMLLALRAAGNASFVGRNRVTGPEGMEMFAAPIAAATVLCRHQ